jgi:hypothetical protein
LRCLSAARGKWSASGVQVESKECK